MLDVAARREPAHARARRIVLTAPDSPRAERPSALARRVERPDAATAENIGEALAKLDAAGDGAPILVAGSLYLVGEALKLVESTG